MTIRDVNMREPLPGPETMDRMFTLQCHDTEKRLDVMIGLASARILCKEIHADQPTV